jgi:hypothetical protein
MGNRTAAGSEEVADDDEENEFLGMDDGDDVDDDEEDDIDDDEMDNKSSDASGSPASTNSKRMRSNTPPPSQRVPSLDAKVRFTTDLLYINGTDLGHVMSLLEQHCPIVLETYNEDGQFDDTKLLKVPERVEINVDVLMEDYYNVFTMIRQYCRDHAVKSGNRKNLIYKLIQAVPLDFPPIVHIIKYIKVSSKHSL